MAVKAFIWTKVHNWNRSLHSQMRHPVGPYQLLLLKKMDKFTQSFEKNELRDLNLLYFEHCTIPLFLQYRVSSQI